MSSMSDSVALAKLVLQAIQTGNIEELRRLLLRLPIESMKPEKIDKMAALFLSTAQHAGQDAITRELVDYFDQTDPNRQQFPFLVKLLLNLDVPSFTRDGSQPLLSYIYSLYPHQGYLQTLDTLIENNLGDVLYFATTRLDDVFGTQPHDVYRQAFQYATGEDTFNATIVDYLEEHLRQTSRYAEIPEWVYNFAGNGAEPPPYEDELVYPELPKETFKLPSLEQSIEILTGGLSQLGLPEDVIESKQKQLEDQLRKASTIERKEVLLPIFELQERQDVFQDDPDVFALVGPVNALYGYMEEHIEDQNEDPCVKYGGCRMLTCNHFLDVDPYTGESWSLNWFTGSCDYCFLKIRNSCHAVRKPRIMGGWEGCFCSFECLIHSLGEQNLPQRSIIRNVEEQLKEYGIQDRRSRNGTGVAQQETLTGTTDTSGIQE